MYTPILSSSEKKKMIWKGNVIFRNWQLRSAMVVFIYTLFYPLRLEVRLRKIGLRNPRNNFGGLRSELETKRMVVEYSGREPRSREWLRSREHFKFGSVTSRRRRWSARGFIDHEANKSLFYGQ